MKQTHAILFIALALLATVALGHDGDDETATVQEITEMQQRFESNCGKRAVTCLKQTDVTEGPYYYQTSYIRKNITYAEGFYLLVTPIVKERMVHIFSCKSLLWMSILVLWFLTQQLMCGTVMLLDCTLTSMWLTTMLIQIPLS
jgi:hypothetical protein